jgi:hypothetical protein
VTTNQRLVTEEAFYRVGLRHDDFILTIVLWKHTVLR